MITDTEGIILRKTEAANGRRMVLLFSRKFGKISVGTDISDRGKSKSSLAMRPFTYGRYTLFESRGNYNMNKAETLTSYFGIGEDVDKFMNASYVLELTDKLTEEGQSCPGLLNLLLDFMAAMENRRKNHKTLTLAYEIKALKHLGLSPVLDKCASCGNDVAGKRAYFSIPEGGLVCENCFKESEQEDKQKLIYEMDFGIVDIIKYFLSNPMKVIERVALDEKAYNVLHRIIRDYLDYHIGIGSLKSERLI